MSSLDAGSPGRPIYRHALPTRLGHWLSALCLLVLIMSGLQIFNAHPTLYWGDRSDPDHALFQRVRVERQLGYKMAKYIKRIELVDRFDAIGHGKGSYWEDRGYEWYAGI